MPDLPHLNIWIPCYDDLEQLREAVESVQPFLERHESVSAYVVDGRYATFEGETNCTPGADGLCSRYNAIYVDPSLPELGSSHCPQVELPWGDPDAPDYLRSPQHEQAKWVNYELLPQDEWALEMDTDERLEALDLECLAGLDPRGKYTPEVLTPDGEQLMPAIRLYQPQFWTFWIDDVMFWREFYPRDTPTQDLVEGHVRTAHRNTAYGGTVECLTLRNHGADRPAEYQERRADQLDTMGAEWAAEAVRDGEYPSLIELQEEYDTDTEEP